MKRREFIVALLIALSAGFGFWYYQHIVFEAPLSKDVDLSELFKSGPNETMGPGYFLELAPSRVHKILFVATDPTSVHPNKSQLHLLAVC